MTAPSSAPQAETPPDTPPGFGSNPGVTRLDRNRFSLMPGTVLFHEGQAGTHAFWIESGRIDLTKVAGGIPMILALAKAGDIIGEMALIDGAPRSATATTASDAVVTSIPAAKFQTHIDTLDPLAQALLRKFTRIIRTGNNSAVLGGQGALIGQ